MYRNLHFVDIKFDKRYHKNGAYFAHTTFYIDKFMD